MMHQKPISILTIHRGSIDVVGLSATTDFHLGLPRPGTAVSRATSIVLHYGRRLLKFHNQIYEIALLQKT
jgi:hypothetical protein